MKDVNIIMELYNKKEEAYQHLVGRFRNALFEGDVTLGEAIMAELARLNSELSILRDQLRTPPKD